MDNLFRSLKKGAAELQKAKRRHDRAAQSSSSPQNPSTPVVQHEELDVNLSIDAPPRSVEQFLELRDAHGSTPQGGAAIFLLALHTFAEDPTLGLPCLTIAVDATLLAEDKTGEGYKGKTLSPREYQRVTSLVSTSRETARGYWKGATPENSYTPDTPLSVAVYRQSMDAQKANQYTRATRGIEQQEQRLFIRSAGYKNQKNSGRPIGMAQNSAGIWKAKSVAGIVTSLMKETVTDDGDDL